MIKKFNKFNKFNKMYESEEQDLVDSILDKISEYGYENLSAIEKEIINKASTDGIESLSDYIDRSDDAVLTYDKLGHILINGVSYTEWANKSEKEKKPKDKFSWNKTSKHGNERKMPPYRIRVYKKDNSNILYYYIFWVEGDLKGTKKKWVSVSKNPEKDPFGSIYGINSWKNDTMEDVHKKHLDNDFDRFKDLSPEELNEFETFLNLRKRWRKGEFNENTDENRKFINGLKTLYKKFSNA